MAPGWIERAREALERNAGWVREIAARGGSVRPTGPVEMGGDGKVHQEGLVEGRVTTCHLDLGVDVSVGASARLVRTADGESVLISGGENAPIQVYDAGKIMPEKRASINNAMRRDRRRRRKRLGA